MSPVISADVSDEMKERVDAAREDGESRSAAVRRLVRESLNEEPLPHRFLRGLRRATEPLLLLTVIVWSSALLGYVDLPTVGIQLTNSLMFNLGTLWVVSSLFLDGPTWYHELERKTRGKKA